MVKKTIFILLVLSFLLSCGDQVPEELVEGVTTEDSVTAQSDLLVSPDDIIIDPSVPIVDDLQLLSRSPATLFNSKVLSEMFGQSVQDQRKQLKSSLDFSSLTVNYFNSDDFDASSLISSNSVGPLKIVDFGPSGELPVEMRKPTIYALFNQPMVPLSKLGEPMTESPILSIDPPVSGTYRWMGTKMISFEAAEPMFRNRDYKVTIKKGSASIFGKELPIDFSFIFHNEPLEILELAFGNLDDIHNATFEVPPQKAKSILLTFNQAVEAEVLEGYISVFDDYRTYPVTVEAVDRDHGDWNRDTLKRMVRLIVGEELPFNSEIQVHLLEGARANKDSSPREDEQVKSYKTLSPFGFQDFSRYSYHFPMDPEGVKNPVYLKFSHPLNKETILENISTEFIGFDLSSHIQVFDYTVRISDLPVEYDSEYQVFLKGGIEDIYGRALNLDKTITVEVPEAANYSRFPGSDGFRSLEAQFNPNLIYEFQNIDKGSFSINGDVLDPGLTDAVRNEANYKLVDLTPYLNGKGFGSVNVNWNFEESYTNWKNEEKVRNNTRDMTVQVTDLAISTRYSYNKFLIWVNHLSTGEPAAGASVSISGLKGAYASVIADEDGFALIELGSGDLNEYFYNRAEYRLTINLSAELDGDRVDLPVRNTQSGWRFGISSSSPLNAEKNLPRVFIFSDRGLYKPGETLTFRGMDWNQHMGKLSPYEGPYTITIEALQGYNSKELVSWDGLTTESGGFYDTYQISPDQDPGDLRIVYERGGEKFYENVKVAYFRRLNFQAQLKPPVRKYFIGDKISIPVEATYLSGGALAEGDLSSYWTRKPVHYYPPGDLWTHSVFGPSVGWLRENVLSSETGKLSIQGTANLSIESTDHSMKGMAYRYVLEATVEDIDRQTVSVASSVLVHPASYYIGASIEDHKNGRWRRFVPVNQELEFAFSQVDPEGEKYIFNSSAEIEVIKGAYRAIQQNSIGGNVNTRYEWVEETLHSASVKWLDGEAVFKYTPTEAGSYRLRIAGRDRHDRQVITDLQFYVSGGSWVRWAGQNSEDITLDVEQDLYFVGDTARILVKSPLEKGKYLLTIEREGILEEQLIYLDPSNPYIEVEIEEDWIPVMYVTLTSFLARSDEPDSYFDPDFGKPKGIFGAAALNISTATRELDIEVVSDKAVYKPGETGDITVRVTQNGEPVANTEITYLAVDRGVLDLINYHIPNPLDYFYNTSNFKSYGAGDDSRRLLLAPVTYDVTNLSGGDGEDGKLKRREDFTPLAVFEPFLKTDEKGEVHVQVNWPDTLTSYRSTVIALKDDKIGYSEDELYVKNPINVRTALPRQMRVRDTAFAGVVITNIDRVDHDVTVNIESKILTLPGDNEKTVTVPAGRSFEVPFILEADKTGEGEILFTIHSDVLNEELAHIIKVEKPLIKESFTTTGIVSSGEELGEEALIIPAGIGGSYGSLIISMDSSQAPFLRGQLTTLGEHKVFDYTFDYLYRALPGIIAPAVTKAMGSVFESGAKEYLVSFLKYLRNRQREDGGIASSAYMMNYSSNPFCSLVSMHMIQILKTQNLTYKSVIDEQKLFAYLDSYASDHVSDVYFNLYLHYINAMAGNFNKAQTDEYLELGDDLGISGYAMVAYAYELEGRREEVTKIYEIIKRFVSMGTRSVDIRETYESRYYFDSMYQQLSHLLRLGIITGEAPQILSRYTESLNEDKNSRNWITSQDRLWMTMALSELVISENPSDTNFEGSIVIDEETLMKGRFQGFSRKPQEQEFDLFETVIPLTGQNNLSSLQFRKTGPGNLYYSTTLKYALPNEVAMMRDEGLSVFSQIENLEGEVMENNELGLGETYRMRVLLNTSKSRSFVNLTVPIPSGAEIVDPGFATSSAYRNKGGVNSEEWTRESEYGDENTFVGEGYIIDGLLYALTPNQLIFDQEIRYSWDNLYYGQREISFLFRCTTPGIYPTPPASADLLFEPEVFGRDRGRLIVIH